MPAVSRKTTFIKLTVVSICAVFALFCFQKFFVKSDRVSASAFGPTPSHTGAPDEANCTACHSDFAVNSGTGSATIGAIPASYTPNQQISITVTTSQADAVIYGFQLTAVDSQGARAGTFILPTQTPEQIQVVTGLTSGGVRHYVEHTGEGVLPTQFGSKSWTFTWRAPNPGAGTVRFFVAGNAANSDGNTSGDYIYTSTKSINDSTNLPRSVTSDFDGDGKADVSVFRPSTGVWYLQQSTSGFTGITFGQNGDLITPADYDGDRKTDVAVFRAGTWYLQRSSLGFTGITFGQAGDIPVPADYDGDGKADVAVFRPSTGTWYLQRSTLGFTGITFGQAGDKPVAGDYDGDGKSDVAVNRAGTWYIQRSQLGFTGITFGDGNDKSVPADYDGDGKTDVAVFRPSNGAWYLQQSTAGFTGVTFGISTDLPVPADYDGDGKADVAVFRNGTWYLNRSQAGFTGVAFGAATDKPVPNAFVP